MPVFYVFTDAVAELKPGAYAPAALLAHLQHHGDFSACNRALARQGYGAHDHRHSLSGGLTLAVTPAPGKLGKFLAIVNQAGAEVNRDTIDLDSATSRGRFVNGTLKFLPPDSGVNPDEVRADLDRELLMVLRIRQKHLRTLPMLRRPTIRGLPNSTKCQPTYRRKPSNYWPTRTCFAV